MPHGYVLQVPYRVHIKSAKALNDGIPAMDQKKIIVAMVLAMAPANGPVVGI